MKLLAKYNRVNLFATILIFLVSSMVFFFLVRYILIGQVDVDLVIEQKEIQNYVARYNLLPEYIPVKDQQITYEKTGTEFTRQTFSTYTSIDSLEKEKMSSRKLIFGIEAGNQFYMVTVSKSLEGTDDLLYTILLITFSTILIMLVVSLFINRMILQKLWKPFYSSLNTIRNFRIDKSQHLHFNETGIDEFDFMNDVIQKTTNQAKQDYLLLKEFTENASHEIQTPLAIIQSKLDLLIQSDLSRSQTAIVQSAYQAIEKLSRLNYSLLLLAKIENNQFAEKNLVDVEEKIKEKINAFTELWQNQSLIIKTNLQATKLNMNKELADILLNNLFSNASRHNKEKGTIQIILSPTKLIFKNSSLYKQLDESRLFTRFGKLNDSTSQNGLGLSIIKQICEVSGFKVDYQFEENLHCFVISW